MNPALRNTLLFAGMAALLIATGFLQSWNVALTVVQMGLISAIMALGVNIQWGYAGLLNVGVMGFVAIGGLAAVLVAAPVDAEALSAGGARLVVALLTGAATILAAIWAWSALPRGKARGAGVVVILVIGYFVYRALFDPARDAVEAIEPALRGNIGGFGLPIMLAWPLGGILAAGVAWIVGKTALGLRSDYLAIATLGISEIIIAIMKNEDWLARGVKNIIGLPRPWPVPYEIDIQTDPAFIERAAGVGLDPVAASTLWVDVLYSVIFLVVLLALLWLAQAALASPWGRMMRAIRDNETAAEAMGKDVTGRHLQVFILGSAVLGVAGAMMVTLDGQLTPGTYQPLRFTFLIWVMVIVGGSGNNFGAVLGGMLIWFLWVQVEALGPLAIDLGTAWMGEDSGLRAHLISNAPQMRLLVMGVVLLVVLRFFPRGLIPREMIVTFLPAAGRSSRMEGRDKLLETIGGTPLLRRSALTALRAGVGPVIVGVRPGDAARRKALSNLDLQIIEVTEAGSGFAATLRAGARAALAAITDSYPLAGDDDYHGMMISLPDMPDIETDDLVRLVRTFGARGGQVVRGATEDGEPGHPVLFPDYLLSDFDLLEGDAGAGRLLADEPVVTLPLPGLRAVTDLDTPDDWAAWRAAAGPSSL